MDAEGQRKELAKGVESMEKNLEALTERERAIREGLVPFLAAREKVAEHEAKWKKAKVGYAAAEKKAKAKQRP